MDWNCDRIIFLSERGRNNWPHRPRSESSMLYPGLQIIISQNKNPVCFFPWVGVSPCGGLRWWQDSSLAYCQWHCRRRRSLTKTGQRARKQNCWLSAAEIPLVGGGRKQERLLFAKITIIFSGWHNVLLAHFAGSWKAASEELERERPLSLSLSTTFSFLFLLPFSLSLSSFSPSLKCVTFRRETLEYGICRESQKSEHTH